jgi:hypothetical protein
MNKKEANAHAPASFLRAAYIWILNTFSIVRFAGFIPDRNTFFLERFVFKD